MTIATNVSALDAYRNLNNTQARLSSSLQKLSSGSRINSASDDAAGLSISEGLKSQISGLAQAGRNAQDGVSVIQTADGALSQVTAILHRMRDLAVQGANDSNSVSSRAAIKTEADQLGQELDRIGKNTNFNGINLLDGTTASLTFQVGAGASADNQVAVSLTNLGTTLGTLAGPVAAAGFDVTSNATATTTLTSIDTAIDAISTARSNLGASENRLQSASDTLAITGQNLTAANSRIADTDMAAEMVKYTQSNILSQAGTAMLAQANQSGQGILKLLQ
ncbi:MAG: flagellin [Microbacteriaceae bacterium]|nr:MAG: flagellin [Microbacteriaceae bacterium]